MAWKLGYITYCKEGDIAVGSINRHGELPGVPVTKTSNYGLKGFRGCDEDGSAEDAYREDAAGDEVCDEIDPGKESWVKRGSELMFPFLTNSVSGYNRL